MDKTILVIGGSGMLGEPVARQLATDGYKIKLLTRRPKRLREKFDDSFEIVEGDVEQASLKAALEGCNGVHVNLMGGPRPQDFDRIEHQGTARIARLAAEMCLGHLTYLSGAPACEVNFHDAGSKAKFDAEVAIRNSGVPFTIFRVTWFMEALKLFIRGKRALIVGTQAHPLRWVAVNEYARMVSLAFQNPDAQNKTFFVVGPESYSKPEALKIYTQIVRPDVKVTFVPIWLMKILAGLSFNAQLQADIRRMAFYDTIGDDFGDPTESNEVFGAPTTTLRQWCEAQNQ